MTSRRKGFTLIELLVVIAIIAILAAILFPVFAKARDKARQAACLSNVKQMALGIMMYKDDYDNTYPPMWVNMDTPNPLGDGFYSSSAPYPYVWEQLIYPYTKNFKIIYCPNTPSSDYGCCYYQYGANDQILGYAVGTAGQGYIAPFNAGVKSESAVGSPADKFMIMDWGSYQASWYYGVISPFGSHYLPGGGAVPECATAARNYGGGGSSPGVDYPSDFNNGRHSGGINAAFADGHAKFQQSVAIYSQTKNNTLYNYVNKGTATPKTPDPWTSAVN